jgi:glyine---[glycyl-carrier protein] ligase
MWSDGGSRMWSVVEGFEAQVRRTPSAVAVVDVDGTAVSYAELNGRANRLARLLVEHGVHSEVRVALVLDRCVRQVVAVLAVLKAGGAYVPIDPGYPAARIGVMCADSAAALALTTSELAGKLPPGLDPLPLDTAETDRALAACSGEDLVGRLLPDAAMYVIYTSGSTGVPKGVVVSHAAVARLFAETRSMFHFGPEDVWTLFHSYSFDFAVWEQWGALLHGGRLVLVPRDVTRSPQEFLDLVLRERVTVLCQTASAFLQFLQAVDERGAAEPVRTPRRVILGGEALEPARLASWHAHHPQNQSPVNVYGATEATVYTTVQRLDAALAHTDAGNLIGTAVPGSGMTLLDAHLRPVAPGEIGEVHLSGPGVARGYLGRPGLTAERFVPDPAGPPGARMYRTGDLARVSRYGVEFVGRADQQVKIRGFRIELGEVEATVCACPAVTQAAVLAREDQPGEKTLVAYVVAVPGQDPDELACVVRDWVSARLPGHMVPGAVVAMTALPLTLNGKLDRKALPAPSAAPVTTPRGTETERRIAAIWTHLLGRSGVTPLDHFLELGGHSLTAIRIAARVRADLCGDVQVRDVYDYPRLADFATRVDALRTRSTAGTPEAE